MSITAEHTLHINDHDISDEQIERWTAETVAPEAVWVPGPGRTPLEGRRGPTANRTVRIPEGIDKALRARAEADSTSPSEIIRKALTEYLARRIAEDGYDPAVEKR
jgi:hypothetical protein